MSVYICVFNGLVYHFYYSDRAKDILCTCIGCPICVCVQVTVSEYEAEGKARKIGCPGEHLENFICAPMGLRSKGWLLWLQKEHPLSKTRLCWAR